MRAFSVGSSPQVRRKATAVALAWAAHLQVIHRQRATQLLHDINNRLANVPSVKRFRPPVAKRPQNLRKAWIAKHFAGVRAAEATLPIGHQQLLAVGPGWQIRSAKQYK
jgi:hypothetical protein